MFRQDYARLPVFSGLDATQISQLSPLLVECHFPREAVIFRQGQPADYIYILISGEVTIQYKPYDGPLLTVARIDPGGVFGWSAALGREVYTSEAVACQESCVVRVRGDQLNQLCKEHPETGLVFLDRLAGVIGERLQITHTKIFRILSQGVDQQENQIRRMA